MLFLGLNTKVDVTITFILSLNIQTYRILLKCPLLIEHLSIKLLSFLHHLSVLWFHLHSCKLFLMHFWDEVLSLLEIIDSFVRSFLFFFQFYDAIFYLTFLVVYVFVLSYCIHHFVLWGYNADDWALSSSKICILWLRCCWRTWWLWLRLFHIDIRLIF